jgi:AGCS family alanine or glycine:cation symporter
VDVFAQFISSVNSFVWGPWMLVFLVGTGIFLTVRLGFWQFQMG